MKPFYYLSDFPDRKPAGKNFVTECPKCGKKHLSISRDTGLYHCFYAGCDFHGRLKDFWDERPSPDGSFSANGGSGSGAGRRLSAAGSGSAQRKGSATDAGHRKDGAEVPMIPEDYKRLSPEVLARIKPLTDDPQTTDADQLAARRYLAHQGISLETAIGRRIGCLVHRCFGKEENNSTGAMYHCIAYVNYVNGHPVNVKYRSCDPSAASHPTGDGAGEGHGHPAPEYVKCWSQDSPTTPCPPYNIDCINPLLVSDDCIRRVIITEGEKDVLTLLEAGYPYVISVPNGAASDLAKGFEAFDAWLNQVHDFVICGDCDLPGRTLVGRLTDYFGARSLVTTLPTDCKDISDVLAVYGAEVVREIIDSARPLHTPDIISVSERTDEILNVLQGHYDHGYDVGYGPLTDRVFHPTDLGGLMIVTGKPNSGKTDFLNDLTCRLMAKTGRHVCYLSFEVPDKNKHVAHLIRLMLGKVNTADYTREELQPIVHFLNEHMVHLDLHETPPTPAHILERADRVRRSLPLKYLVIDPYLFMEVETGRYNTETQAIKAMLTQMQTWGRVNGIWVIIVAHPRGLKKLNGKNELEEIDMYTISGSANWANLADFILSITRVNQPDKAYTQLDVLKVRDQDLCQTGSVLFVRQPCGRYDERDSVEQVVAEGYGRIMNKDRLPWINRLGG